MSAFACAICECPASPGSGWSRRFRGLSNSRVSSTAQRAQLQLRPPYAFLLACAAEALRGGRWLTALVRQCGCAAAGGAGSAAFVQRVVKKHQLYMSIMHCQCFMCLSVLIFFHHSLFLHFPCTVPTLFFHFSFTFTFLQFSYTFPPRSFTFLSLFLHCSFTINFPSVSFHFLHFFFHVHIPLFLHCSVTFLLLFLHFLFLSVFAVFFRKTAFWIQNSFFSNEWCRFRCRALFSFVMTVGDGYGSKVKKSKSLKDKNTFDVES